MLAATDFELREDFASFLERDLGKDLLRFTTAGSVDDGKSTLIGRLLHDSKAVYEDQLSSVKKSRVNRSGRAIDFSLLTDGLRAEREQGITIDVAYRYFSTPRRKFIIADTPGHEQYTRNMATGASTADLAVILVDGTKGVLPQTRRHAYISALLGIPKVVAAINKMDLVAYREERFLALEQEFCELARSLGIESVQSIPISALEGDNVVERSARTPWYAGLTLIEYLETVDVRRESDAADLRFPIQQVIRPDASFRGFAGTVASGTIRPGDQVLALPSRQETRVRAIVTYGGELTSAVARQSVVLQLADEIDLSRGDLLVSPGHEPAVSERFTARTVWMHAEPLSFNQTYLVKHCGRQIRARALRIHHRIDINDFTPHAAHQLEMNEIGLVEFQASSPLVLDSYEENRLTGSFILIDPLSNATVGAAMIYKVTVDPEIGGEATAVPGHLSGSHVGVDERSKRHQHLPAVIAIDGQPSTAERLEESLFAKGFEVLLVRGEAIPSSALSPVLSTLWSAGLIVVYAGPVGPGQHRELQAISEGRFFSLASSDGLLAEEEVLNEALEIAERLRIGVNSQRD
jgi:sulfate adenylyltransferase large subunit